MGEANYNGLVLWHSYIHSLLGAGLFSIESIRPYRWVEAAIPHAKIDDSLRFGKQGLTTFAVLDF